MSFAKSPLRRGLNGRAASVRFVEVEMPAVAARPLVVELNGGGRVLLSEPARVALLAQMLVGFYSTGNMPKRQRTLIQRYI